MRRAGTTLLMAVVGVALYVVLLTVSSHVPTLPTAHHSEWISTLEGGRGGRTQLDLVYAATHWYESAVLIAITATVIGIAAGLANVKRATLLAATVIWVAAVVAVTGTVSVPDVFALILGIVSTVGGAALVRRPAGLEQEPGA